MSLGTDAAAVAPAEPRSRTPIRVVGHIALGLAVYLGPWALLISVVLLVLRLV